MPALPLRDHSWYVLTHALPTLTTRYHTDEAQASLPDALPAGTLVMVHGQRHKHVEGRDQHGYSQLLVPVIGVEPSDNPNAREDWLKMDHARTAWRRWCDREATVNNQRRFDQPTPVLGSDPVPVRPATAEDVQPLFDAVQAARRRALDTHRYTHLHHYNKDVATVLAGLTPDEKARLVVLDADTPHGRWEASGLDAWRFAAQHANRHAPGTWAFSVPTTPRSQAGTPLPLQPEDDATALLRAHGLLMRWIDRTGPSGVSDWLNESLAAMVSDGALKPQLKAMDQGLQRLPSLDKPSWTLAEQDALNRLIARSVKDVTPWFTEHVRRAREDEDPRLMDAQTLHRPDEPASSAWNTQAFWTLQRETLPLLVQEVLWQRKLDIDLQMSLKAELEATMRTPADARPAVRATPG